MLRISCPWCGPKDEPEYAFGGESHVVRPTPDVDDATWAQYLFQRENPKGVQFERWCHSYGCGQWFNIVRDTVTHEILTVYQMGAGKPAIET